MTFKEYVSIDYSTRRRLHSMILKIKEDEPMLMLKHSLVFDGRFYGAETKEELDDWNEYMSWIIFKKQQFFKSLGVKYLNESEQSQQSPSSSQYL